MNRLSHQQNVAHKILYEALEGAPRTLLSNWLLAALPDLLSGAELEALGDAISRKGHMKARKESEWPKS